MPLLFTGTLPVAAVNVGLVASLPGLAAKSAKLTADATQLGLALVGQVQVSVDFPPNPAQYAGAIAGALNPLELAAVLNPLNVAGASLDLATDAAVDLALVTAQLTVAESVASTLNIGLEVGGVAGYSYSGPAPAFGSELERYSKAGIGKTPPSAQIQAVIIATESFASWGTFSQSVNTDGTAGAEATSSPRLAFMGELPGSSWNPGVASVGAEIDLLVADLRGQKSGIEASFDVMLGVTLPDPQVVVEAGLNIVAEVGIDGLLESMVNVQADITGSIGGVTAQIDAVAELAGGIAAQISAGGLAFWTYTGTAAGLGEALRAALVGGIPGGTGSRARAYGLVLVGTPANMTLLGSILKTS
ncbi:MAG TPA: hypothetical protein VJN18_32790 [Polyangiaceae bacterium]|nr:hypothetical protein [Polyangiaceae bacterium]